MGKILTEKQVLSREASLEKVFNYIKSIIDSKATQIATDMDRMNYLISSDGYDYAVEAFWDYFKQEYNVDNIEKYYDNKIEMMRDLYIRCLMPYNLELDIKYGNENISKEDVINGFIKVGLWLKGLFQRLYLSIIGFIALILSAYASFYYSEINEVWLSSLFLGVSGSILAALIITTINRHIKKIIVKLEYQDRFITNEVSRYLDQQKKDIETFKENDKDNKKFILDFVQINNSIKSHLRSIGKILSVTVLEYYKDLVKIERDMFNLSSKIVRREYESMFENVTSDEKNELILLVFKLETCSLYYKSNIEEYLYNIKRSLSKLNKKTI
ncbi:MAG: hypothetical protein AB7E16_01565 [Candidatus Izemoplasmatales bacterium]